MALYISVINHNHDDIICNNTTLKELATKHIVILKSNTNVTQELQAYCKDNNITLLKGDKKKGFGANNNEVFFYIQNNFEITNEDLFLVMNPDIKITLNEIEKLIYYVKKTSSDIASINLYKDLKLTIYDNSIRHYPQLLSPIKTLLGLQRNDLYEKENIIAPICIDWAAGSFLLFTMKCYIKLKGFNEKYYMYFEDVDICARAHKKNCCIYYFPDVKAVHYAQHDNRKLFSRHNMYYIISYVKYFTSHKKLRNIFFKLTFKRKI